MEKMSWKDWPAWLKGGIISSAISIIFLSINFLPESLETSPIFSSWPGLLLMLFFLLFLAPGLGVCDFFLSIGINLSCSDGGGSGSLFTEFNYLSNYFLAVFSWFLIGAIIGFIYGKIKSKKAENSQTQINSTTIAQIQ